MRLISTKMHGVLDYLVAAILIASPWLFHLPEPHASWYVPVLIGIAIIFYSALTNYELGILKIIPMSMHLSFDLFFGVILATSPWVFRFSKFVYLPHLVGGLLILCVSLITSSAVYKRRAGNLLQRGFGAGGRARPR